jgi:ATP-dependent DNA helicase 2 subunit 2
VTGRKRKGETEKPLSGLDVEGLLGREKRAKISPDNAIPEFKQMLATTEEMKTINDATKQMISIIEDKIQHSTGNMGYGTAVECIGVLREELTELEEPGLFNDFMKDLKEKLKMGKLGGDRREMWYLIRSNRLGLIDKKLSPFSDVSEEESKQVSRKQGLHIGAADIHSSSP